jgi:hypothetical protein
MSLVLFSETRFHRFDGYLFLNAEDKNRLPACTVFTIRYKHVICFQEDTIHLEQLGVRL